MSNQVSNLYAARVFSEHPIALWALDDDFSFISKLSEENKNILNWNLDNLYSDPILGPGLDTVFNPSSNDDVYAIAIQPDGKIIIGGNFTTIGGVTRNRIARLNSDGTLDTGFNPNANANIVSIAIQSDGKILIGGNFTTVSGTTRNYIARLNSDGTLDSGFNPNANLSLTTVLIQPDGKILIGGYFTTIGGVTRNRIARLNSDGTLDTGFNPNANSSVLSIAIQQDGKILIGGFFDQLGLLSRSRIARLNNDGTVDTGFDPTANSYVASIAIQADGKIIIGGQFTVVNVTTRNRIARLNSDGTLDTEFSPNVNANINSLSIQPDGKILIGGYFTTIGGVTRNRIARLNSDGTLDSGFNFNVNNHVLVINILQNNIIIFGGEFSLVNGLSFNRLAKIKEEIQQEIINTTIPPGIIIENSQSNILSIVSSSLKYNGSASGTAINSITDLDPDKKTLSINAFVYNYNNVSSFDIGFIHSGSAFFTSYTPEREGVWTKISHTLNIPTGNVDIYPYFKVNYKNLSLENFGSDYDFVINALSVGQWSELHHYQSTGTLSASIDPNILSIISASSSLSSSAITGVIADSYGIAESKNGYYIVEKNRTLSYSNNFPITFGATNITNITYPLYGNIPSMVFPGEGFLNESGRYKEITLEFWLRTHTNATSPIKIFGPLTTTDGIYIEKDFISIKIGQYKKSYFIGKWYRPMLLDFRYNIDNASLLINGDLVIEMDINQEKITLADKDYNYLGIYGNENIYPFEIDAFAIYPYIVPEQIAKKRFIYAQGVESANNIVSNFKGDSFQVDFPFAKYTSTLNYPDMNDWNSGFFNNSISTSKYLTNPEYSLPQIIFSDQVDIDDFLTDNYNIQGSDYPFIKLRPNSNYNSITSSIVFPTLNVLNSPVKSIFGVFRAPSTLTSTKEVLMYFSNNFNNNTFTINVSNLGVEYFYNDTKIFDHPIIENDIFTAGFDIDFISQEYASTINNFFSNPQNISFSLGGNQFSVFSGKIFNFTFNNRMFTDKDLTEYIHSTGFIDPDTDPENLIDYIGNYTLYPQLLSNSLIIDVASSGYWEDSIPLSYFGKLVEDKNKNPYYDLDLMQFNIETPSPLVLQKDQYYVLDGGLSTTLDFELYFNNGTPTTSASSVLLSLDGGTPFTVLFTEYLTQEELDIAYGSFSKDEYTVKTYITLQNSTDVGNIPYTEYTNSIRIGADRVLDLDKYTTNQINNTKFEVTDRTIIFPPKELVDFADYYITIHLEIQTRGINTKPIKIKRMSISSLAYDESSFYSINSPDGYKLYPFNRYGDIYAYKLKNPFTIYKDSTSYMYNTGDSGISVLPYESTAVRGITIPINQQLATEYLLGGVQFWSFYNMGETIEETVQVGKISTRNRSYDIKLVPESNYTRAKMVLFDEDTSNEATGIVFYQNGNIVDNPYIQPLSWNSIIITFEQAIDIPSSVGQLEIYEGLMVNNIAFYKKSSDVLGSIFVDNEWRDLRSETTWGTWYESGIGLWGEIEGQSEPLTYVIDGKSIYESTFGLSSVVGRDDSSLFLNSDGVTIITGTVWEEFSGRPV